MLYDSTYMKYVSSEHFPSSKRKPQPDEQSVPTLPSPNPPPKVTSLLSIFVDLPVLDISYR